MLDALNGESNDAPNPSPSHEAPCPPLWLVLLTTAMAGGMGWGIRGQYGHETGAMIPGVLVALTLVFLFCPHATSLHAARAVALTTVAFGFGGSMTYGQTLGLSQDQELVGNLAAFRWGMLGTFIKGGAWIGLAGAFLGMGLSGKRYRPVEMLLILAGMIALLVIGIALINQPFDPANRVLPPVYFSDAWHWEPDNLEMEPRFEKWGGLLLALVGLIVYVGGTKKDRLAENMAMTGFLAGGFGFSIGQCVQASHAWHPEWYQGEIIEAITRHFNWWNMMETTFGLILGFGLGLGLWLNRRLIAAGNVDREVRLAPDMELLLVLVHAGAILAWNLRSTPGFDAVADLAVTMGVIPLVCIVGGRYWPYMLTLPLVTLPIAGKTLHAMCYGENPAFTLGEGWTVFLIVPMVITLAAAFYYAYRGQRGQTGRPFTRQSLILCTWLYFALNFAFFNFPWPWEDATSRSPNNWIFFVCAVTLTVTALVYGRRTETRPPAPSRQ